jgi:hypothetical protein
MWTITKPDDWSYAFLSRNLARECGVDPADLVVSITENDDQDWSCGFGRPSF